MKTKKSLNVDKGGTGGGGQSMWEISFLALLSVLLYFFLTNGIDSMYQTLKISRLFVSAKPDVIPPPKCLGSYHFGCQTGRLETRGNGGEGNKNRGQTVTAMGVN